jgi:hypothetical protein
MGLTRRLVSEDNSCNASPSPGPSCAAQGHLSSASNYGPCTKIGRQHCWQQQQQSTPLDYPTRLEFEHGCGCSFFVVGRDTGHSLECHVVGGCVSAMAQLALMALERQ